VLRDNWPGAFGTNRQPPSDGFGAKNTKDNDVTTATLPLGTKCVVFDPVANGWVTFIYLQNDGDGAAKTAVGTPCLQEDEPWAVATDPDTGSTGAYLGGMMAVATCVVAVNSYAWYWCGGPCPQDAFLVGGSALSAVTITATAYVIGAALEAYDPGDSVGVRLLQTAGAQCIGFGKTAVT